MYKNPNNNIKTAKTRTYIIVLCICFRRFAMPVQHHKRRSDKTDKNVTFFLYFYPDLRVIIIIIL